MPLDNKQLTDHRAVLLSSTNEFTEKPPWPTDLLQVQHNKANVQICRIGVKVKYKTNSPLSSIAFHVLPRKQLLHFIKYWEKHDKGHFFTWLFALIT